MSYKRTRNDKNADKSKYPKERQGEVGNETH